MKKEIIQIVFQVVIIFFTCGLCFAIGTGDLQDLTVLTPADLANRLVGAGNVGPLPLSPPAFTGSPFGAGAFTNGLIDGLGISNGVILGTGDIFNAVGPNVDPSAGLDNARAGSAALDLLIAPQVTADASVLEFNFVPPANVVSVTFKYVFASEEYPENVATGFNDVFGLFVDGQNIALIPGTTTPISINTLNATATPSLFNDNFAAIFGTQFDGFSAVLTATVAVTPGVARQISLAIADGTDRLGDSAVFVAPVTVTGFFDDVPLAHFAFSHIQAIFNAAITAGCSANPLLFCPDDNVTRGEMAAFIARAVNGGNPALPCATPPFTDVPITDPFCPHVQFIKTAGISLGFIDGTFRPLDVVTRGQMAAFLIRGVEGEPVGACAVAPFPDVPIDHTFCIHIERLKARAITLGFPDGTYRPGNGTLRDEMAIFLGRAFLGLQ